MSLRTAIASLGIAAAIVGGSFMPNRAGAQPADAAERATTLAREGRFEDALALLAQLRAAAPDEARWLHEEILVLGWAERDTAVMERAPAVDFVRAPTFVLTTIAKAARNQRRFDDAALWYRRALSQSPGDADATIGLALTEADRGDVGTARATLEPLATSATSTDALLASAYVAERAGHPLEALRHYERALALDPGNRPAARGKALALRALLLPTQALAFAASHEGALSDAEIARLRADETALALRLVTSTPYPPAERAAAYARALDSLDAALAATTDPPSVIALRADRVLALALASRNEAALEEFARLRSLTASPPFEALVAAGRANLDIGRADDAVALLEEASAQRPDDLEVRFDLVFAYLAANKAGAALRVAHELATALPAEKAGPDGLVTKGNPVALRAEIVAALAEAYTDQLASAQRRLEALLAKAPNNTEARRELANVYRWRGWLDRSQSEYRQVLAVEPESLDARAGYAHARLDAAAFTEVERTVADLRRVDAADPTVRRLARRWSVERRSELSLDAGANRSSGTTFGSDSDAASAVWLSAPLGQWRAMALAEYADAEFPEGEGLLRRAGGGAEYRSAGWLASAAALRRTDTGNDLGLRLRGERRLNDLWRVGGFLETDSTDTPLRGRRVGLETDVIGTLAEFRPNENGGVSFGWRRREHSDGNDGDAYSAQGWFRLRNDPRSKLDVTGELATARNATDAVPYFSPRHDLFVLGGLRHTWRLHRRGDRSLVQIVDAATGRYDQAGQDSGSLWRLGYRFRVEWSDALHAELRATRARMFYDGAPEHMTSLAFALTARL